MNLLQEEESSGPEECEEESDNKYDPVQSLAYDHGISLIPLPGSPNSKDFTIGHHELQV